MNRIKKITVAMFLLITGMFLSNAAQASSIDNLIQKSDLNKTSTIAVSVKNAQSGKTVYEYNEHKLMNPASVQKIFTMKTAYNELGADYTFKTTAFIDKKGNLYIKLGADPTLTKDKLITLLKEVKQKHKKAINDIVVDGSIIDNTQWGTGWMWDDETNPLLPKYSPYSINQNKIDIVITPGKNGLSPEIKNKSSYAINIINLTKNGDSNEIVFERTPWISSDTTKITGTVKSQINIKLPVSNVQRYFMNELNSALASAGIKPTGTIKTAPVIKDTTKIAEISSIPLEDIIADTLKNSNNFYSEMIFKTAASHSTKSQGTTDKAIDLFKQYYSDIKSDNYIIADACGISRNNLITADWITNGLNKIYKENDFERFGTLLPKPMEGTLRDRLLDISLKLRAKTGTASGISSIAGYIDTKSGKKYTFAILIQNHTQKTVDIKKFEDEIIREIYKM